MLFVSLRVKVGLRQYEPGFGNYMEFFREPLYWNTFPRTAVMSLSATAITMFDRLREGSTPVLNAVSLFLMAASAGLAPIGILVQRPEKKD